MKKIFFPRLAAGLLLACKEGPREEKQATEEKAGLEHAQGTALSLNGNVKWKSDSSTLANVHLMEKAISTTAVGDTPAELEKAVNKMISECKMKGPDHDMLHTWLEPILHDINRLKTEPDAEKRKALVKKLDEQIRLFHTYFEYP